MRYLYSFLLLLGLFIAVPTSANAANYYVSTTGNDSNNGSQSSPFKTVNKAISVMQAGDEIHVASGTYNENITINSKNGTSTAPIIIVGDSLDPNNYPVLNGGDANFTGSDRPIFNVKNSSWIVFERMKFINSTESTMFLDNSHYITFRRNIVDYHKYGILLRNKSSHLLMEYNDIYQSYPANSTWTSLKDSKYEGGALTSFGGAGMNIIRYNYIHDSFNGIFLNRDVRVGNYYDANIWIYKNRFERIVDDPYEPETYGFNNHFFQNTLIDTHRIASFAPEEANGLGPVYLYNNLMYLKNDPTKEAASGRLNSAMKIELHDKLFTNSIYFFNNSIDANYAGTNSYGNDMLNSKVNNFKQMNNIFVTLNRTFSATSLNLVNSSFTNDMANGSLGYAEPSGYPNTNPLFSNPSNEDLRLQSSSPARGKSIAVSNLIGFSNNTIISQGSDLGAFQFGENGFRNVASPSYVAPSGGEDPSFPANTNWPADVRGGVNPLSNPKWMSSNGTNTPSPSSAPTFNIADLEPDGDVDGNDFVTLVANFSLTGIAGWIRSDIVKNGVVDIFDFNKLITNFGQ